MIITAIKEEFMGNDYTSTRLISKNKADFLYGKIEARMKLPSGRGTWPALWMLPTDWVYGGWPTSGEIDIMEFVGYDPLRVHGTIHTGAYNHMLGTQKGGSRTVLDLSEEFHTFKIIWTETQMKWYVDDIMYYTTSYDPNSIGSVEDFEAWPFDEEFHFLINIAVGGAWGGAEGIDESIWPQSLYVDYLRVYQKDYVTNDIENPSEVRNISLVKATGSEIAFKWGKAIDDMEVKQYNIYINDTFIESTTLNAYKLEGLQQETEYTVYIEAEDYAGNKSEKVMALFATVGPPSIPGKIEAEDYITIFGDEIKSEGTSDTGGGENMGWIGQGDYLEYSVDVDTIGTYQFSYRVASQSSGGSISLYIDGVKIETVTFDATGGWQNWSTVFGQEFDITSQGTITIRLVMETSGFNLNYIEAIQK